MNASSIQVERWVCGNCGVHASYRESAETCCTQPGWRPVSAASRTSERQAFELVLGGAVIASVHELGGGSGAYACAKGQTATFHCDLRKNGERHDYEPERAIEAAKCWAEWEATR